MFLCGGSGVAALFGVIDFAAVVSGETDEVLRLRSGWAFARKEDLSPRFAQDDGFFIRPPFPKLYLGTRVSPQLRCFSPGGEAKLRHSRARSQVQLGNEGGAPEGEGAAEATVFLNEGGIGCRERCGCGDGREIRGSRRGAG